MSTQADRDEGRPSRVLVAVDDSPAALRAVRLAVAVAATAACPLLVVTVVRDGALSRALGQAASEPMSDQRRQASATSMVRHALGLAESAGVRAEGRQEAGSPGQVLLAVARQWRADLVVIGRNETTTGTFGRVGDVAAHVLELSDVPVLVVP